MSEATVITSENSAEFYSKKLDLAPIEQPEAKPGPEEPDEVDVEAALKNLPDDEPEEPEKHEKPNRLNKRFSELTKQREQALETAQRERERAEAAEKRAQELELKLNPPKQTSIDAEPQPNQFTDAFEYAKALAEWSADKALKERDAKEQEARFKQAQEAVVKAWNEKQETVKTELPDYEEVMASAENIMISDQVRDAIIESENGPKIAYYLAKNPDEAEEISKLSVRGALLRLGKIEAKLESGKEEKPKTTISKAPAPITPLKGANAPADVPVNAAGEFIGTYAQWKTMRREGKIK